MTRRLHGDPIHIQISSATHSKPRPAPRRRVLPPSKFNGMIPEPLYVDSKNFMTTAVTDRRNVAVSTNIVTNTSCQNKNVDGYRLSSDGHRGDAREPRDCTEVVSQGK